MQANLGVQAQLHPKPRQQLEGHFGQSNFLYLQPGEGVKWVYHTYIRRQAWENLTGRFQVWCMLSSVTPASEVEAQSYLTACDMGSHIEDTLQGISYYPSSSFLLFLSGTLTPDSL